MKCIDRTLTCNTPGDNLGARFLAARTNAGMKRKEAAEAIGMSVGQLGRLERGGVTMVSEPGTIIRAARAYGVNQVWLYAGSGGGARYVPDWYSLQPEPRAA